MQLRDVNTFSARYEVLRNGGVIGTLEAYDVPEVLCDTGSDLVMSFRGTFRRTAKYNYFTDRLRPVVTINDTEYPLGVYIVTTGEPSEENGQEIVTLEAYSLLYLARRKKIEERLHISAGKNYMTAITELLALAGISTIDAETTDHVFATDREDWDIGTAVLEIVNELLDEISFEKAYVDLSGCVKLRKYTKPTLTEVDHTYTEGIDSLIIPGYKVTADRYNKANVFRVTCDNPDMDGVMVAVSENNSESSPFSTVNIGRVLHNEQVNNVPSIEALQARADALRDKSMQTTEKIEFVTAIVPTHSPYDVVALQIGETSGIFVETGWQISISPDEDMKHTARRVIQ